MPVLVCVIDLDDGARLHGQVTHRPPEEIEIGMRLEAYFEDIGDEVAIPKFKPIK